MKKIFTLLVAAALAATTVAAQDRISVDGPDDSELCNLPVEAAEASPTAIHSDVRRNLTDKECSDMVMAALAVRKAARSGPREVNRAARKTFNAVWRALTCRHEVMVSYGFSPYIFGNDGIEFGFDGDTYRYGDDRRTYGLAAGYMYRLSRRWSVGLSVSISTMKDSASKNGERIFTCRTSTLGIVPALRLNWIDRPMVKCYSELQAGYACDFTRIDSDEVERFHQSYPVVTLTMAGISVGRRLHGFAEFGAGLRGIACVGVGYSFR